MPTYQNVEAEFTPAEVHQITGVSPELQRDWRRRKYLPASKGRKHKRFRASELGYLFALGAFSRAGVAIERVKGAAGMAALPIWDIVFRLTAPHKFGDYGTNIDVGPNRYIIVLQDDALPTPRKVEVLRTGDLSVLSQKQDGVLTIIFDCVFAAQKIIERAPRPCVSVKVSK